MAEIIIREVTVTRFTPRPKTVSKVSTLAWQYPDACVITHIKDELTGKDIYRRKLS